MDLFEESRDERLIEDYLFSGYKPHNKKSTFDADQQFARPIEDEDLFSVRNDIVGSVDGGVNEDLVRIEAVEEVIESSSDQFDFDERPFRRLSNEPLCVTNVGSPGKLFEDEVSDPLYPPADQQDGILPEAPIDDIFLDDYSDSGDANNENIRPQLEKSYSKPAAAPQLTPAEIKKKLMKERLKQQAIAIEQKNPRPPGGIGSGFEKDGTIELTLEHSKLTSDSRSKLIFDRLFNLSKKAGESGKSANGDKMDWITHKNNLRKQICAQKRKVWNSFQAPADGYDEEEELIGTESIVGSQKDAEETEDSQEEDMDLIDNGDNDADEESNDDEEVEEEEEEEDEESCDESNGSDSVSICHDEVDIAESDLEGADLDEASAQEDNKSAMQVDEVLSKNSESDSDDEVIKRRVRIYDDSNHDNNGSVLKFIDDEVDVDEDI